MPCICCSNPDRPTPLTVVRLSGVTESVCEECREDVGQCDNCETPTLRGDLLDARIDGNAGYICGACTRGRLPAFRSCGHCDRYSPRGDIRSNSRIGTVCLTCLENDDDVFGFCSECDEWYRQGDGCACREDEDRDGNTQVINDYSSRVTTVPVGKGPVWAGVELEVEVRGSRDEPAKAVKDIFGDFVLIKNDGSLNNGFEIVTRPASLEVHKQHWERFFAKKPANIRSWGPGTCGMHVHMTRRGMLPSGTTYRNANSEINVYASTAYDRELTTALGKIDPKYPAMSQLTVAKIVMFVNAPRNYKLVTKIAGRSGERWARIYDKPKVADALAERDRYEAVNLTGKETIEFRIFRGTLNRSGFFKNLEFCFALKDWASTGSDSTLVECQHYLAFIKFVNSRKKEFPHLAAFLADNISSL